MPYTITQNNGRVVQEMFNTRRDAEYYLAYNRIQGRIMFHNQRAAPQPRPSMPIQRSSPIPSPPVQRRSLIPNMIGTYNPNSAIFQKTRKFRPATTKKTMSEMNQY